MDPIQRLVGSVVPAATAGQPVISVDTKKMELLGCYNNAGSDYRPRVRPRRVKAQTSRTKSLAKLSRNRGYDLTDSTGRVNVRVDHDTAEFAVKQSGVGSPALSRCPKLDDHGRLWWLQRARVRLCKLELQEPADQTGLAFTVGNYPPGTKK